MKPSMVRDVCSYRAITQLDVPSFDAYPFA
jgi:hypothetical protein